MSKEMELTKQLKKLGVENNWYDLENRARANWTIETCIKWLRNDGFTYSINPEEGVDRMEITLYRIPYDCEIFVIRYCKPGHELEGLLECMIKVVEKT